MGGDKSKKIRFRTRGHFLQENGTKRSSCIRHIVLHNDYHLIRKSYTGQKYEISLENFAAKQQQISQGNLVEVSVGKRIRVRISVRAIVLCCVVLSCGVLCCAILRFVVLCCVVVVVELSLCRVVSCCVVLWCVVFVSFVVRSVSSPCLPLSCASTTLLCGAVLFLSLA